MAVDWSQFKPVSPTNAADAKPSAVDWSQFKPVEAPAAGPVASQLRTSANVDRSWGEAITDTASGIGQAGFNSIAGVVRGVNDRAPGAAEAERESGFVAGLLMDVGGKVYEAGLGAQRAVGNLIGDAEMQAEATRGLEVMNARRAQTAPEDLKRSGFAEAFAEKANEYADAVPPAQSEKARLISAEMAQLSQTEDLSDQAFATIDYFASPFLRGDLSTGGARVSKIMESLIPSLAAGGIAAKAVGAAGAGAGIQTAAQLGTMSVMEGGGAAEGARGEVLNTPIEALQAAPEFQAALRMTGGDPLRARDLLADQAASISFGLGTAAAGATMGLGQAFGANVAEQAVREGVGSLATGAGVRQALLGTAGAAGKEFTSEFAQGASNQAAQNVGVTATGASDSLWRGVVAAGIMEGIAGGASGVAAQAAAEVSKRLRPIEDGEDLLGGSNVATGEPGAAEPGGLSLPDDPAASPITSAEVETLRQQQLAALLAKRDGRPDQTVVDPVTGRPVTVRGEPAQALNEAERQILGFLQKYADRPDALARALGRRLDDSATTGASPQTSEAPNIGGAAPNIQAPAAVQPAVEPVAPAPVAPSQPAAIPVATPAAPAPQPTASQPAGIVASALRPQPADDLLLDQAVAELQGMDEETPTIAGPVAINPQPEEVRNEEVQQVPDAQPAAGEVAQQGLRPQGQQEEVAPTSAPQTGIVAGSLAAAPADPDAVEGQLPAESTFAAAREREIPSEAPPPESFIPQVLSEIGWLQKGGYMIRDPETAIGASSQAEIDPERGDVTDRTKWIGKPAADGRESQFWRMRPNRSLSEEDAANAVAKWRQGRKLGPRQQEFIDYMLKAARDYAEQWNTERAETMRAIVDLEAEGIVEERDELRAAAIPDATPEQEREALALEDMLRRARALGATREQLEALILQNPKPRDHAREIWHFINQRSPADATDQQASPGGSRSGAEEGSRGQAEPDRSGEAASGEAEAEPAAAPAAEPRAEGLTLSAPAAPPVSQQARAPSQQGGLFAPPTRREQLEGEAKRREDERNGKNATGRTDMIAGDGELFAGPRPEQVDVEQAIAAEREPLRSPKGAEVMAVREESARQRFVSAVGEQFGIGAEDALRALTELQKARLVSLDPVSGQFKVKDGRAWDAEVIRRAAGLEQAEQAVSPSQGEKVEAAAAEAATSPENDRPEPTDAQREAGNYKKGALSLHGLRISIENPAGTRRRPEWPPLAHHYGYFRGTEGKDGDHVDVFVGPDAENADLPVFVVDQVTQAGRFDEHKVMLGFRDEAAAREGYLANYSPDWQGLGDITQMTLAEFKAWVIDPARTSKRASADAQLQEAEAATVAEAPAPAPTAEDSAPAPIRDFGEKIGGARKDTAMPTGARGKSAREAEDERPTWAKRYEVSQVAASTLDPEETGRWMIRDKRTKDRMGQQKLVGERAGYATREEAEAALPLIELARNHRITMSSRADGEREFLIVRSVTDRKYVVLKNGFASREDAMRYMVENAVELIETRTSFGEIDLPLPPSRERRGAARRERDVRDSDFSDVFGFRGVEFGNWNNQAERQELLNDAYDGLIDLSDVLGIPPRAISLGGELALAFGARGHGLSGARAHYEPTRPVINLTKENGAGSLAHEWMHALDHYLWRRGNPRVKWKTNDDGTRSLDLIGNDFDLNSMSGGTARDNVRAEIRELFQKLNVTMSRKAVEYVNDTAKVEAWVAKARDQVKSELDTLRGYLARPIDYAKRNNKPASADQLAAFDTLAEQILTGRDVTLRAESPPKARKGSYSTRWTNDAINGISAILKAVRGTEGFASDGKGSMNRIANFVRYYAQRLDEMAKANEGETEVKAVPTDFKRAAKELDQGRTGDYWSLPSEMLARAFQGYVEDKIAERGGFSPFLNFGPEQAVIVSPWGFVAPFPRGAERKAINAVFDELFQTLQVSDEGDGRVGLFSRPRPAASREASLDQTQTPEFKAWFGDWQALRAQQRMDAMDPIKVSIPPQWRGFSTSELRRRVAEVLDSLVRERATIEHPEVGPVRIERAGQRKTISEGRDPAKLLIAADLVNVLPSAVLASRTQAEGGQNYRAFVKLVAPVDVGGTRLAAVFTLTERTDGTAYYNAVALEDQKQEAPTKAGAPTPGPVRGSTAEAEGGPLLTEVAEFSRRPLIRVNPDSVSKVVDAEGRPLVVYHGAGQPFDSFDPNRIGSNFAGVSSGGFFFSSDRQVAEAYADGEAGTVVDAFLALVDPLEVDAGSSNPDRYFDRNRERLLEQAQEGEHDGIVVNGRAPDGEVQSTYVAFYPEQIKSATGNRGTFDPADPRIAFSQPQPGDRIPMGALRSETAMRLAVAAALDGWAGQKPIVRVVRTAAELPADAKMGQGWQEAEGYFDGDGGVWLVTDNLTDPQRALEVLRHEAVGHFGVERIAGAAWPSIVAGIEAMRGQKRNGMSKPMAAALAEAEARYEAAASDDPLLFAKELLAVMSETGTRASFMDRMLSQLRAFLRKVGLIGEAFSEAELRNVLSGAFRLVERGGSLTAGAPVAAGGLNSIRPDDVAAYILKMMTDSDADLFRYPKSDSTSFARVVQEVSQGEIKAVKLGEVEANFTENLDDLLPAMKWGLRLPDGSQAFVYIEQPSPYQQARGLRMFIDASAGNSGASLGSAAYAALFQWALNTNHVFIGDPNGLSTEALLRRTEHMLSAALKHGTTRMMEPHDRQIDPMSKKWGPSQEWAHPLQWTDGDDVGNITALIRTSVENHLGLLKGTEADGAVYRLSDGQFIGAGGQPLTDEGLRRAAATAGARFRASGRFAGPESRAAAVGGSTVARTLVLQSILEGSTGSAAQRRELLAQLAERLSSQRLTYDRARRVFYSRPGPDQLQPQSAGAFSRPRAAILAARQRVQSLISRDAIDRLIYEFQDKFVDLKRIQAHIREAGGTVSDLNDAYLGEELYHSRVMARHERFMESELKPLLADLNAAGFTVEQFEQFLHARHAPEANAVLMKRNPDAKTVQDERDRTQQAVRALEIQLQKARNAGAATAAIEQALEIAEQQRDYWKRVQPFRGTDAERAMLSGMSDADAAAAMAALSPADRAKMDALAGRIDAINAKTLDQLERYGLMSRADLDAWRKTYQFYVPLHRDEANPDSTSHPTGAGFSVRGDAAKSRTGSAKAKVTNILAHIAMQREAAITRGEKNAVAKKLYVLAGQNPDPKLWTLDKAPTMKRVDPVTGTVRSMPDPTYRQQPNVVMVRIAGEDRAIVFNERNTRALRLAESLKNLDVDDLHVVLGWFSKATRWLASVNTQYNPVFGIVNLIRDTQGVVLQLSTTPLKGKEAQVLRRIPAMLRSIYRERRGKGTASPEDARLQSLWDDMRMSGGVTGYRDLFRDPMERANAIEAELQKESRGTASRWAHAVVDWLSDYNEAIENATRLAAYEQALAQGMTKERAASIAKNITVNFNRKGRQARELGALYAFFNAAVQGTARMLETLSGPRGRAIMAGGVALGFVNSLIGLAVMGGDEWEKIPAHVKERAVVIPISGKDYISIPMPLGYHVFPNIGRIAAEMMTGTNDTAAASAGELLRIGVDSFNPLGGTSTPLQMIMPTALDPVAALAENRDWTGRPIYREDFSSTDPTPGFTRSKDTASMPAKVIAWGANAITGGDDYEPGAFSPTPDQIDYVIGQLTGGLGREILKAQTTLTAPITGEELPAYKIPLVSRLYGNTRGQAGESERFYSNLAELNIVERRMKGMARAGEDVDAYMAAEPLTDLVGMGTRSQSVVQRLRSAQRQATAAGDSEQAEAIRAQITEVMAELNREVRAAKQ